MDIIRDRKPVFTRWNQEIKSRKLRKYIHIATPRAIFLRTIFLAVVLRSPGGLFYTLNSNLEPTTTNLIAYVTIIFLAACVIMSTLLLIGDLRTVLHKNEIPVLDIVLDSYPFVLFCVSMLASYPPMLFCAVTLSEILLG